MYDIKFYCNQFNSVKIEQVLIRDVKKFRF